MRTKKLGVAAAVVTLGAVLCACSAPSLPAGVWPHGFSVPKGTTPSASKMLVPLAQMVAADSGWEKQPTPPSGLKPYLVQGCAEASTNFAEIGALPDEYEVIVACPTAGDITKLWARIDWSNMLLGKWTVASSAFGTYGQQSRTYVKHYVYDSDGDACWAYLSLMTVHNALAIAGLCDYDDQALAQTRSEAQTWDYTVVQRILSVQG